MRLNHRFRWIQTTEHGLRILDRDTSHNIRSFIENILVHSLIISASNQTLFKVIE